MVADPLIKKATDVFPRNGLIVISILMLVLTLLLSEGCHKTVVEGDVEWHALVDPYRHTVSLGQHNLHYIDMGSGEPLVMVHGFADSTYTWHKNVRALIAAGFRLIMVDQPGLGRSDIPPEPYVYSIENQADAILKLIEHLGLTRFNLMGHSMGGGIVLYIGLQKPSAVKTVVAIDPACFPPPMRLKMTYPLVRYLASLLAGRWSVELALKDVYFDNSKVDAVLVEEYFRPMQKDGYWKILAALQKQYFSAAYDRMTESYGSLRMPLLIIWGEQDKWLPMDFGSQLHTCIPGSEFVTIANCGHNTHQECCESLNRAVTVFYGKHFDQNSPQQVQEGLSRAAGPPALGE